MAKNKNDEYMLYNTSVKGKGNITSSSKMAVIGIVHEEFEEGSYDGVYGMYGDLKETINTGNVVKDFKDMLNYLQSLGCSRIVYSSTVDDFLMDNNGQYGYDDNNHIVIK